MDVVSVPLAGGEAVVLADGPTPDYVIARLGETLVIQPESVREGAVLRANADGSGRGVLVDAGRYVGAFTAACGAVLPYESLLKACPEP